MVQTSFWFSIVKFTFIVSTTVGSNGGDLTTGVTVADSIIFIFAALAFLVASFRPTEAEIKVAFFTFDLLFDDEGSTVGGPDLNKFR